MSGGSACDCGSETAGVQASDVYCSGKLMETVQKAKVYPKCKTYVNLKMLFTPERMVKDFKCFSKCKKNDGSLKFLVMFVDKHFVEGDEIESVVPKDLNSNPSFVTHIFDTQLKIFGDYLNNSWRYLCRSIKDDVVENPNSYSTLYVPNPYIVAGGDLDEWSYWHSYWIVRGLLYCDMCSTARGMIENFLHLVKTYGYVPSSGRLYYLGRSNPPMLIPMVKSFVDTTNDDQFLVEALPLCEKEFMTFTDNHKIEVNGHTMYMYKDSSVGPRPEAYREDIAAASSLCSDEEKQALFSELRAASESGMEFSSRWFIARDLTNIGVLKDTKVSKIIPVDLNAIIFNNCKILAEFHSRNGNVTEAHKYQLMACKLQNAIKEVLWNSCQGVWLDYDLMNFRPRSYFAASNLTPLWARAYSISETDQISQSVLSYIKSYKLDTYPGGVPSTLRKTDEAADFPQILPPFMYMIIEGLNNLGTCDAKILSRRLGHRFVKSIFTAYESHKKTFDRYNAEEYGTICIPNFRDLEMDFASTNGILIEYLVKYADQLNMFDMSDELCGKKIECGQPKPAATNDKAKCLCGQGLECTAGVSCCGKTPEPENPELCPPAQPPSPCPQPALQSPVPECPPPSPAKEPPRPSFPPPTASPEPNSKPSCPPAPPGCGAPKMPQPKYSVPSQPCTSPASPEPKCPPPKPVCPPLQPIGPPPKPAYSPPQPSCPPPQPVCPPPQPTCPPAKPACPPPEPVCPPPPKPMCPPPPEPVCPPPPKPLCPPPPEPVCPPPPKPACPPPKPACSPPPPSCSPPKPACPPPEPVCPPPPKPTCPPPKPACPPPPPSCPPPKPACPPLPSSCPPPKPACPPPEFECPPPPKPACPPPKPVCPPLPPVQPTYPPNPCPPPDPCPPPQPSCPPPKPACPPSQPPNLWPPALPQPMYQCACSGGGCRKGRDCGTPSCAPPSSTPPSSARASCAAQDRSKAKCPAPDEMAFTAPPAPLSDNPKAKSPCPPPQPPCPPCPDEIPYTAPPAPLADPKPGPQPSTCPPPKPACPPPDPPCPPLPDEIPYTAPPAPLSDNPKPKPACPPPQPSCPPCPDQIPYTAPPAPLADPKPCPPAPVCPPTLPQPKYSVPPPTCGAVTSQRTSCSSAPGCASPTTDGCKTSKDFPDDKPQPAVKECD